MFWLLALLINVYRFAVVGAIFELLWLPGLGLLFILPVLSFIYWAKEKFIIRSLSFFSLLIVAFTFLLIMIL